MYTYIGYVLVESTENSKTLKFQTLFPKSHFLTQFLKIVPSKNFPLYSSIISDKTDFISCDFKQFSNIQSQNVKVIAHCSYIEFKIWVFTFDH